MWLESLRNAPRQEVQKELVTLMGIGRKVADCISLISLDKMDVIPVDTHVWKIAQCYLPHLKTKKLNDTYYNEIGDYFRTKFGPQCGWAHSVLFAGELSFFKDSPSKEESSKRNLEVKIEEEIEVEEKVVTPVKAISKRRKTKVSSNVKSEQ